MLIEDLKRWVTPSAPIWLTSEERGRSICITSLEEMGKIRVTCKNRSVEERKRVSKPPKPPAPPFMRNMAVRRAAPSQPQRITMEEAQKLASKAAEEAAKKAIEGIADRLATPTPTPSLSPQQLEEALSKALAGVQLAAVGGKKVLGPEVSGPEEPIYIPKGIVTAGSAPDLDIQSSSSKDSSLGSAASALKALKGKRNKKGSK